MGMTDEQIKQNAIKAAAEFKDCTTLKCLFYDGYITGAHSRNDEIVNLQEQLETCRKTLLKCTGRIIEVETENNHLSNPWISVEKRLPEEEADNISIPVVAITNKGYWFKGQYDYDNKDWFFSEDPDHLDFETDEFVTHWMPIPKV